uniref:Uncharacterized protein n=1 Tax=Arundo donax TaxID=35708 RepID=A0A0A9BT26_ARUDO
MMVLLAYGNCCVTCVIILCHKSNVVSGLINAYLCFIYFELLTHDFPFLRCHYIGYVLQLSQIFCLCNLIVPVIDFTELAWCKICVGNSFQHSRPLICHMSWYLTLIYPSNIN